MKTINIHIDRTKKEYIEPNLFSHNMEHTRSSMFYGLSAQLLRNRKFAGKPACCSGEAAEWYRIGSREAFLTLNRYDAYVRHYESRGNLEKISNELNSQVVQNPTPGVEAGVGQERIPLKKGQGYEVRAVIKGRGESAVTCCIRLVNQRHNLTYVTKFFELPNNTWHKIAFSFVAPSTDPEACFEIVLTQCGEISIGVVSLLPDNHCMELRADVIEHLREIGPAILRWPGGNFAGEYRWKDGLMESDMRGALRSFREIETQPHTHGFDFHEMGIDEFIKLCRMVGAEPYITINLAWDDPKACAEFVEYCNGSTDTKWGALRAERGYPEPYAVKYWSLGNEFGLGHMEGPNTPQAYTDYAICAARKMREVDPDLIFFSSGAYNPAYNEKLWIEESLPRIAEENISFISYHEYVRLFDGGVDFVTQEGLAKSYESALHAVDASLQNLQTLRSMMNKGSEAVRKVHISFDEWNMFFAWYHEPCVIEGIYTGLMLEMFCKHYKELDMPVVMYFQPINEGAIIVKPYESYLSANGQVFALMKEHKAGYLLDADCGDTRIHCLASEKDGEITATFINTAYKDTVAISPALEGKTIMDAHLLIGESLYHGSRFLEKRVEYSGGEIQIPAHSLLQIKAK